MRWLHLSMPLQYLHSVTFHCCLNLSKKAALMLYGLWHYFIPLWVEVACGLTQWCLKLGWVVFTFISESSLILHLQIVDWCIIIIPIGIGTRFIISFVTLLLRTFPWSYRLKNVDPALIEIVDCGGGSLPSHFKFWEANHIIRREMREAPSHVKSSLRNIHRCVSLYLW